MSSWDFSQGSAIYEDIQEHEHPKLSIYALESFANIVDDRIQNDLFRKLILSHADIARRLEVIVVRLEASEKALKEAQEIAQLGRWEVDFLTGVTTWSESLYHILQLDPSVPPATEIFLTRVMQEDRPQVNAYAKDLQQMHEPVVGRYRIVLPDGTIRWVHVRLQTDFDNAGNPTRSYGTLQDITTLKKVEDELERYSKQLEQMVSEKVQEITEAQMATIYALVKLAESRDDDTGAHIERTASFCRLIAKRARALPQYADQIDDEFVATIYRASPLHDIGKVGISDQILLKPGKLTPEEFTIMKSHVEIGYQTLKSVEKRYENNAFIKMGLDITRFHHEKWDGSGYLFERKGTDIPLSARIMALSDVYDALRSRRVYKEPFSHEQSVAIISEGREKHFDPALVDVFLAANGEFKTLYDSLSG